MIKKNLLVLFSWSILSIFCLTVWGQPDPAMRYFTRNASVSFSSFAPLEKIEASTNSGSCVIDISTGQVEFAVLIRSFNFKKALMQEHFNENYMESNKYPKAIFKGMIPDFKSINWTTNGTQTAGVQGDITIHGVTKPLETKVVFRMENGKVFADADFDLIVADFNISIPSVVRDNIARTVKVKLKAEFQELKKT